MAAIRMAVAPVPATLAVVALSFAGLLAGCAESDGAFDVEVRSGGTLDAQAVADAAAAEGREPAEGRGRLAGVVVDEAVRPIAGASVRLPTLDLVRTSGRDGSFWFPDLEPGPYLLHADAPGHHEAQALVEVAAGDTTTVKVLLTAIPADAPYHATQSFGGFAETTDVAWAGFLLIGRSLLCSRCDFEVDLEVDGRHTVFVEATMAPGPAEDGFEHFIRARDGSDRYGYALTGNPMRLELSNETLGGAASFELAISPWSWPVPETDKRFQVFVTAFYHGPPPPDWSILQEGT